MNLFPSEFKKGYKLYKTEINDTQSGYYMVVATDSFANTSRKWFTLDNQAPTITVTSNNLPIASNMYSNAASVFVEVSDVMSKNGSSFDIEFTPLNESDAGDIVYNPATGLSKEGKYTLIDEDIERKMYHKTKNILEKNGYNHYEISNFAKKGFESKHNLNCWDQKEYLGFGLAAHSYYRNKRFSNVQDLNEYIDNIEKFIISKNVEVHEIQDRESKAKEFMLLGLRKIDGVSISEFERRFRVHPLFYFRFEISRLEEDELIEVDLDKIRLTKRGLDLANQVFEAFV